MRRTTAVECRVPSAGRRIAAIAIVFGAVWGSLATANAEGPPRLRPSSSSTVQILPPTATYRGSYPVQLVVGVLCNDSQAASPLRCSGSFSLPPGRPIIVSEVICRSSTQTPIEQAYIDSSGLRIDLSIDWHRTVDGLEVGTYSRRFSLFLPNASSSVAVTFTGNINSRNSDRVYCDLFGRQFYN